MAWQYISGSLRIRGQAPIILSKRMAARPNKAAGALIYYRDVRVISIPSKGQPNESLASEAA